MQIKFLVKLGTRAHIKIRDNKLVSSFMYMWLDIFLRRTKEEKKSYKKYVKNPKEKYMWKISSVNIRAKKEKRGEEKSPRKTRVMQMWCWKNIESYFIFSRLVESAGVFFRPIRWVSDESSNRMKSNSNEFYEAKSCEKCSEKLWALCVSSGVNCVRKRKRGARTRYTLQLFFSSSSFECRVEILPRRRSVLWDTGEGEIKNL